MGATMSLLGLWTANKGLFDFLKIPAALDKQTLVDNLLMECAELEVLYPDAEFMREAIGAWSSVEVDKWEELEKTLHYEYDPISNYDRREEWTDNNKVLSSTAEHYAAGYNANEPTLAGRDTGSGESAASHKGRVSGNIGVMSTQELIARQRAIVDFDVIAKITEDFKATFCLAIY